jgi:hypothetical protein
MRIRLIVCAGLIWLGSDLGMAGMMRGSPPSRLVEFVGRPPASIPHARSGQSYRAAYPPLPRARPSAPPVGPAAKATTTSTFRSGDQPAIPPATGGFPPVVTFE